MRDFLRLSPTEITIARLTEEGQLDEEQRQAKAKDTLQQLAEWVQISGTMQKIVVEMEGWISK